MHRLPFYFKDVSVTPRKGFCVDYFLVYTDVEFQIVCTAPVYQIRYLISVLLFIVSQN